MKYREEFEKCYFEANEDQDHIDRQGMVFDINTAGQYRSTVTRMAYRAFAMGIERNKAGIPIGELMAIFEKKKVKERTGMDFLTFAQCPLEAMLVILMPPAPIPIDLGLGDLAPVLGQAFGISDWQAQATAVGLAKQEKGDAVDKPAG